LHCPESSHPESGDPAEKLFPVEPDYLTAEEDDVDELLDVIRPIPKPPIAPARIPIIASMMKLSNIEPLLRPMAGPPWTISTVAGGF
jgi:hypothetical protein